MLCIIERAHIFAQHANFDYIRGIDIACILDYQKEKLQNGSLNVLFQNSRSKIVETNMEHVFP